MQPHQPVTAHLILTTCAVKSRVRNDKTTNKSRKSICSADYKTLQVDKFTVSCVFMLYDIVFMCECEILFGCHAHVKTTIY